MCPSGCRIASATTMIRSAFSTVVLCRDPIDVPGATWITVGRYGNVEVIATGIGSRSNRIKSLHDQIDLARVVVVITNRVGDGRSADTSRAIDRGWISVEGGEVFVVNERGSSCRQNLEDVVSGFYDVAIADAERLIGRLN